MPDFEEDAESRSRNLEGGKSGLQVGERHSDLHHWT